MSVPVVWFPLQGDYKNIGASSLHVVPIQNGSFVSGKIGQALRMQTTGSDAFAIPELAGKQQISYAYWVKVNTATSTQWLDAVRFYLSDGSTCRQEFYTNCTRWGFWLGNEGAVSGLVYTVGEWMHVAVTVDLVQHVLKVYQNGELVRTNSTLAGDGTNVVTGVNMRIGENNLDVSECDVRIYDTVLSPKEVHDIAQGLALHLPMDMGAQDSSGYGHDGIIFRESEIVSDSPRYEASTHLIDPTPTANSDTGAYARIPLHIESHEAITFAWWGKHKAGYGGGWHGIFSTSANASAPTDYNTTTANHRDNAFDVCNTSGTVVRAGANMFVANEWHYYALVYDGAHVLTYRDGTQVTSHALTGALKPFDYIYLNFSKAGSVFRMNDGHWSDFRVYATALSQEDILELYRTGASIDDQQRLYTHDFIEEDASNLASPFYQASANGTLNGEHSVTFDFTNQRDTYAFFRNNVALEASKTYYVSFYAEGLADGDSVAFYVGGGRSKCDIVVHNGWNVAPLKDLDLAVNSGMGLDDYLRSSSQLVTISDFRLTEKVIPTIEKTGAVRSGHYYDGPNDAASIYDNGDIAAADLIER